MKPFYRFLNILNKWSQNMAKLKLIIFLCMFQDNSEIFSQIVKLLFLHLFSFAVFFFFHFSAIWAFTNVIPVKCSFFDESDLKFFQINFYWKQWKFNYFDSLLVAIQMTSLKKSCIFHVCKKAVSSCQNIGENI